MDLINSIYSDLLHYNLDNISINLKKLKLLPDYKNYYLFLKSLYHIHFQYYENIKQYYKQIPKTPNTEFRIMHYIIKCKHKKFTKDDYSDYYPTKYLKKISLFSEIKNKPFHQKLFFSLLTNLCLRKTNLENMFKYLKRKYPYDISLIKYETYFHFDNVVNMMRMRNIPTNKWMNLGIRLYDINNSIKFIKNYSFAEELIKEFKKYFRNIVLDAELKLTYNYYYYSKLEIYNHLFFHNSPNDIKKISITLKIEKTLNKLKFASFHHLLRDRRDICFLLDLASFSPVKHEKMVTPMLKRNLNFSNLFNLMMIYTNSDKNQKVKNLYRMNYDFIEDHRTDSVLYVSVNVIVAKSMFVVGDKETCFSIMVNNVTPSIDLMHVPPSKNILDILDILCSYFSAIVKVGFEIEIGEDGEYLYDGDGITMCVICHSDIDKSKFSVRCDKCCKYVGHIECVVKWLRTKIVCPYCNL